MSECKTIKLSGAEASKEDCFKEYLKAIRNKNKDEALHDLFMRLSSSALKELLEKAGVDLSPLLHFDYGRLEDTIAKLDDGEYYIEAIEGPLSPIDDSPEDYSCSSKPLPFEDTLFDAIAYAFFLYGNKRYEECYKIIRLVFSFSYMKDFVDACDYHDKEGVFALADLYSDFSRQGYDEAAALFVGMMAYFNAPDLKKKLEETLNYQTMPLLLVSKYYPLAESSLALSLTDYLKGGMLFFHKEKPSRL